jgi:hypothetical protein
MKETLHIRGLSLCLLSLLVGTTFHNVKAQERGIYAPLDSVPQWVQDKVSKEEYKL